MFAIAVLTSFASCENGGFFFFKVKSDSAQARSGLQVVPRDQSITAENAYSSLFLDSARLEGFIQQQNLDDTLALNMRNFYNSRNYQFAWFSSDGFTEQGRNFWSLHQFQEPSDSLQSADSLHMKDSATNKKFFAHADSLLALDTLQASAGDSTVYQTELMFTYKFLQRLGGSDTSWAALQHFIPVKKTDVLQLADSLLKKQKDSLSVAVGNHSYSLLKMELQRYDSLARKGGWDTVMLSKAKTLRKGMKAPEVAAIKKRLQASGDLTGRDTSQLFNDSLELAVKSFQQRHGRQPDGVVTDSLVAVMNIPVEERIKQIIINMNRVAWAPAGVQGQVIQVNVPDYKLWVFDGSHKVMDMKVAVGKEGASSMMFTGKLNRIVFSPYWNIPASIVKEEIMPAMKNDPNYLKNRNMEIVEKNESAPVIRQLPGADNAMGKVKFLFPNRYDIYLHDTPDKGIFAAQKRAVSHGCIRLADAEKLASYLLRNHPEWNTQKIRAAMNNNKEQEVQLSDPVPVSISYLTAWVDEKGHMNFREDIYGHDARIAKMMFKN